jgi:hypothetical protein
MFIVRENIVTEMNNRLHMSWEACEILPWLGHIRLVDKPPDDRNGDTVRLAQQL